MSDRRSDAAFLAGLLSGAAGQAIGHPLDTLKVHAQAASVERLRLRSLWRGSAAPVATAGAIQSLALGIFENVRRLLWPHEAATTPLSHLAAAGSTCGCCVSLVTCPLTRIKVLQQLTGHGFVTAARSAIATGTLFCAFPTAVAWESTRGSYMVLYAVLKRALQPQPSRAAATPPDSPSPAFELQPLPLWARMLAGGGANVINMGVLYPLNTVLSVQQSEVPRALRAPLPASSALQQQGHGILATARAMLAEGGVRRFYRGYTYTLLRAGPVAAAIMPTFDLLLPRIERLEAQCRRSC